MSGPGGRLGHAGDFRWTGTRSGVSPGPQGPQGAQGSPGAQGFQGVPGPQGFQGEAAQGADAYWAEIGYGEDVRLAPQGFITTLLTLDVGPGRYVASASITFDNRAAIHRHTVTCFMSMVPPPTERFGGPRSVEIPLVASSAMSVEIGPAFAVAGDRGGQLVVAAQRDTDWPDDEIWAVEGTPALNRAGASGVLVMRLA